MSLHPVLRLVLLLALGGALFRYSLAGQLAILAALVLMVGRGGRDKLELLYKALRRIRWLLLSIAVIYLLVAPEPRPGAGWALPTWPEWSLALRRAGVLVILVSAVEWLRQTTPAATSAAAIAVLLRPLNRIGFRPERFALRTAMTLDAVPRTAEVVAQAAGRAGIKPRQFAGWAEAAAGLIEDIESGRGAVVAPSELPPVRRVTGTDLLLFGAALGLILGLTLV
jgi:energy-coupling factor transporter transmembrane protein EcfT